MRKIALLCLLGHSLLCQAQNEDPPSRAFDNPLAFSRKAWLAGVQVGYSKGSFGQERYAATHVYGGYFVANKVVVGLAATWGQESLGTAQDVALSAGPMIRYQFTRSRFSPFIVGSYQFGKATISGVSLRSTAPGMVTRADRRDRSIQSGYVGLGMSIRVIAAYRLDLLLTWQDKPGASELGMNGRYNLLQGQIGVNYVLHRNR